MTATATATDPQRSPAYDSYIQAKLREFEKKPPVVNKEKQLTTPRIVGGTPVSDAKKYPFFLEWRDARCGASLIWEDIALSAAHCENDAHPFDTRLFMMSTDSEAGLQRTVVNKQAHPLYNGALQDYDFLVLKLDSSALVDGTGQATGASYVELNRNPHLPRVGDALTAMGFGKTDPFMEGTSPNMQEVQVYYVSDEICLEQYTSSDFLPDLMFCSGVEGGGKDTCQGDSGGPIIHANTGMQVGIVSFGIGCADPDYAGVNARVSAAYDWIFDQICDMSDNPPASCQAPQHEAITMPQTGPGQFTVHFQYDQFTRETAWSLEYVRSDEDYEQVFLQTFETEGLESYTPYSFKDLPVGLYRLEVGDSADDGICCAFGQGELWITNDLTGDTCYSHNGQYDNYLQVMLRLDAEGTITILSESMEYNNSWESSNAVNHPPSYDSQWPGRLPAVDQLFAVVVNVKFDAFPEETFWALQSHDADRNEWNDVQSQRGNSREVASQLDSTAIVNLKTGWYRFLIGDTSSDGICCAYRRGWVSLTAPVVTEGGNPGLVWGNNGEYDDGIDVYIYFDEDGYVSQVSYTDPTSAISRTGDVFNRTRHKRRYLLSAETDLPRYQLEESLPGVT